jgi:hypothetical protein
MAHGLAGDTITAACLATSVPVIVAPAMDGGMYMHPATQANVATLGELRLSHRRARVGRLASGMVGKGRLAALEKIVDATVQALSGRPARDSGSAAADWPDADADADADDEDDAAEDAAAAATRLLPHPGLLRGAASA